MQNKLINTYKYSITLEDYDSLRWMKSVNKYLETLLF